MSLLNYSLLFIVALLRSTLQRGRHCEISDCKRSFASGVSFVDFYSCNTCQCRNGKVKCTKMYCPQDPCMMDSICYTFGELMHNGEMCSIRQPTTTRAGLLPIVPSNEETIDYVIVHDGCEMNECKRTFKHGESFRDFYSCNMCKCEDGQVLCTRRKCPREPCMHLSVCYSHAEVMANGDVCQIEISMTVKAEGCVIKECGRMFHEGEVFKDFFSCNQCLCHKGRILCSKVMCPQEPCLFHDICYNDGEQAPDGTMCNVDDKKRNRLATECQIQECQRTFKDGASFHDFYSCNTCYCRAGLITCNEKEKKCPQEPCIHDNTCYSDGEKMPNDEICHVEKTHRTVKFWELK